MFGAVVVLIGGSCDQFAVVGVTGATTQRPVERLDDCGPNNPAGLSSAAVATLLQGGTNEAPQRLLYPYDGTIFPGGLPAPLVMWEGPAGDAILLQLHSSFFEYAGCLLPAGQGRVAIPEPAWAALQVAAEGAADARGAVELQVTILADGRATGPLVRTIQVASAPLPISIYYMAYATLGIPALHRLQIGQQAEQISGALQCAGCHAVSADGTRLLEYAGGGGAIQCISESAGQTRLSSLRQLVPGAEFGALAPDGSVYVGPANPVGVGPRTFAVPQPQAGLFDFQSGTLLTDRGLPPGVMTPAFSPDGTALAFNDLAIGDGRGLAVMDFDPNTATAANYREVYRDSKSYPAWPSFVRNARSIIFARGSTSDFSAAGAGILPVSIGSAQSDLYGVGLDGGTPFLLARAVGLPSADAQEDETYLPFGSDELHQNYYPQVAPVTVGGYAWLFFDSIRNYGNLGRQRQIWGAALDLNPGVDDPSHPAFYVGGQDATSANLRAVPSLDPVVGATAACGSTGN